MEQLLHYVWRHKILPLHELRTTDGRVVEVVNPGIYNHDAGPDFFNAKVKIDGQLWVGNVEIHIHSSDWRRHHHDNDEAYQNVILHVVNEADCEVSYPNDPDKKIPQLVLEVPDYVLQNYDELARSDVQPRCKNVVATLPRLMVNSWLSALQIERLEERTLQIMARREQCDKNWEDTFFVTMARNFGFGINGDAFETWARTVPLSAVGKHRDSLFQIEAIFFGQAGLLDEFLFGADEFYEKLQKEYVYLKHKFSLKPMNPKLWRFLRLRPQNFPHIRIAQLAMLYYEQKLNFSSLIAAETEKDLHELFSTQVSEYWQTHYSFNTESSKSSEKNLSSASKNLLIINTVAPLLFAYGRYKGSEELCERSLNFLQQQKPESNSIVRTWSDAGVHCESAADSQALIQLHRKYCEPHNCLRCRFGYEFIRRTPDFLKEKEKKQNEE